MYRLPTYHNVKTIPLYFESLSKLENLFLVCSSIKQLDLIIKKKHNIFNRRICAHSVTSFFNLCLSEIFSIKAFSTQLCYSHTYIHAFLFTGIKMLYLMIKTVSLKLFCCFYMVRMHLTKKSQDSLTPLQAHSSILYGAFEMFVQVCYIIVWCVQKPSYIQSRGIS